MKKKLQEKLLKACVEIAKKGKGALIVVGECKYKPLVVQRVKPYKFTSDLDLFMESAIKDGAMILDKNGIVQAYRVKIMNANKVLRGFGTRHSTGYSVSFNKCITAYVVSEQDSKIRIFKEGKLIMEIDALEKGINKNIPIISNILEFIGAGTVGSLGISAFATSIGITGIMFIPGVFVFGSVYYLIKKLGIKW